MVKKKGKSKRTTLKDKYKIQKRTLETHRKARKQAKKDAASGVVKPKKNKDPGIPNSWPFKKDLLKEIQRERERQKQLQDETKEKRKNDLRALREHQEQGGTARTVEEMLAQAQQDAMEYEAKQEFVQDGDSNKSDGSVAAGQQSRRAYLKELKKVIDTADVLLQVLDARDPIGSRMHAALEDSILARSDKKMVLVLNKIDLVPKDVVSGWLTYLRRSHPTIAIRASAGLDRGAASNDEASMATTSTNPVGMDSLLQLLKNYARSGDSKTTIVVGCVGQPNVGKSSIINALKRSRAVGVSSRPGSTTSMQEIVLDRNVRLLDCPGVVFDDKAALLGNCVDADADPIPAVAALLERCDHASLLLTYNLPSFPPGDVLLFLGMVARTYGRVLKGGVPDKVSAARAVLKDWNSGKIPFYTPVPEDSGVELDNDAKIVHAFGAEWDAAVLESLPEKDEMDFVKVEAAVAEPDSRQAVEMAEDYDFCDL